MTEGIRLLVVNEQSDYFDLVQQYAGLLEPSCTMQCKYAESGSIAGQIMKDWTPTVVILDAHLEDANSFELLRGMSETHASVVVTSSHFSKDIEKSSVERGASAYVVASEDHDALEQLLEIVVELSAPQEVPQ